jgi:hypothetical protein
MAREPDPRAELAELERDLTEKGLRAAYVLRGAERYFRARALDLVTAAARARSLEVSRHAPRETDFRAQLLLDDLASPPLFAPGRCVVLEDPEAWLREEAPAGSALERAIASFLASKKGTLVLTADSIRADGATVKRCAAAGGLLKSFRRLYERPPPWDRAQDPTNSELVQAVVGLARAQRVAMPLERALLLVHAKGNDLAALDAAIRDIAAAGPDAAPLEASGAGSPGEVTDALIAGSASEALRAIESLYRGGMRKADGGRETSVEALSAVLLGYLRPRVRQGLADARARASGRSPASEAASVARPASPERSVREWRAMLDDLIDVERRGRDRAELDASEFARLALRWSRRRERARSMRA